MRNELSDSKLTERIIGAFYTSYNKLGFGYREVIYSRGLEIELKRLGLRVRREVWYDVLYDDILVGKYRVDHLVEDRVIVEVKSRENLPGGSRDQLRGGLSAARLKVGLLLHYGPVPKVYRVFF